MDLVITDGALLMVWSVVNIKVVNIDINGGNGVNHHNGCVVISIKDLASYGINDPTDKVNYTRFCNDYIDKN